MGIAASPIDSLLDPFSRCFNFESAQRISDFRVDPAVQLRIDDLAERANEGTLSEDERSEYESLVNTADLISILKLKAQQQLQAIVPSSGLGN